VRLYLAGQRAFGAAVFEAVHKAGHEIVQVSAPALRAGGLLPDRLRDAAEKASVPWLEAGKLRAEPAPEGVDLIVCAHSSTSSGARPG
jgi:methionyl-tRNA formyltransferase